MANNAPMKLRLDAPRANSRVWLHSHLKSLIAALGRLGRTPLASVMTICVIGIALALPGTMQIMLTNIAAVGGTLDGTSGLSVFMVNNMSQQRLRKVSAELQVRPEVSSIRAISPAAAVEEYRALGGEGLALDSLDGENPFPWVLMVGIDARNGTPDVVKQLVDELRSHPAVANVIYDQVWLERLLAMMVLGQRAALVIAVILGVGVVLVVGNTIRLEVQARREEIDVQQLFGGTDAFIRQPFLWTGLWYGVFGALTALALLLVEVQILRTPVAELAAQYGSQFQLSGIDWRIVTALLFSGVGLGSLGAWLAVGRYLAAESRRSRAS